MPALVYLHGLASSPRGRKVSVLTKRFGPDGWEVVAPDLNVPSFATLSFAAIVERARAAVVAARPAAVVGSSLGALAALAVAEGEGPDGPPLLLIAPALGFGARWKEKLPEGDPLTLFHHGEERDLPIHRAFFLEMASVRAGEAPPPVPVAVVMGTDDASVPFDQVRGTWGAWEASGELVPGSRFHAVPGGDHGLVERGDAIEAALRGLLRRTATTRGTHEGAA